MENKDIKIITLLNKAYTIDIIMNILPNKRKYRKIKTRLCDLLEETQKDVNKLCEKLK